MGIITVRSITHFFLVERVHFRNGSGSNDHPEELFHYHLNMIDR